MPRVHRLKLVLDRLLYALGVLHLLARLRRRILGNRALIRSFHAVSDASRPYLRSGMSIDAGQFREVVRLLSRHHRLVSIEQLVEEL